MGMKGYKAANEAMSPQTSEKQIPTHASESSSSRQTQIPSDSKDKLKRVSVLIREDQYELLQEKNHQSLSALIRDLLDQHLDSQQIHIRLKQDTLKSYHQVMELTGSKNEDLEAMFKSALKSLVKEKVKAIEKLQKKL